MHWPHASTFFNRNVSEATNDVLPAGSLHFMISKVLKALNIYLDCNGRRGSSLRIYGDQARLADRACLIPKITHSELHQVGQKIMESQLNDSKVNYLNSKVLIAISRPSPPGQHLNNFVVLTLHRLHHAPVRIETKNLPGQYTQYSHQKGHGSQTSNVPSFQYRTCFKNSRKLA